MPNGSIRPFRPRLPAPRATVRIDAPGVSRRHARIRVSGGEATIVDLGSKNRFRLGRVLLVFRSSPEAGSTMTEHRG